MRMLKKLIFTGTLSVVCCLSYSQAVDVPAGTKVTIIVEQPQTLNGSINEQKVDSKPAQQPALVVPQQPKPKRPPEPPEAEAHEPRRLVRYFCRAWKDAQYEKMWWAMTPQYRKKVSLKKFTKLFKDDKENNGGIIDENITVDDAVLANGNVQVTVDLIFKFKRVGVRRVKAVVEKENGLYRLTESSIIPLDMDDL